MEKDIKVDWEKTSEYYEARYMNLKDKFFLIGVFLVLLYSGICIFIAHLGGLI